MIVDVFLILMFSILINWLCSLNSYLNVIEDKKTRTQIILLCILIGSISGLCLSLV